MKILLGNWNVPFFNDYNVEITIEPEIVKDFPYPVQSVQSAKRAINGYKWQ